MANYMTMNNEFGTRVTAASDAEANNDSLRAYEKPLLIAYGDVRDITLGPTAGEGESGCAAFFRVGPGGCPTP